MTGLCVEIRGRAGELEIEVSLTASEERPVVVVGPNGSGKTTLLMMILGAARPLKGRVAIDDDVLFDSEVPTDVPVERRRIGFLPQRLGLFPHLDVLHNVAYGVLGVPRGERLRRAAEVLAGLDATPLSRRFPAELSGGEAQRVAIGRAIAARPRALLLDEPLTALDVSVRRDVRRFLADQLRASRLPTVVVTHDLADAAAIDGHVLVLERGVITQRGRLAELTANPATTFVRELTRASG